MVQKNNTARIMIGIVVGILLFTMSLSSASAATITVNATGVGANYSSIQVAINNANANDIIEVQSGTYFENVVVNKTLSLKGIGMPLINASGSGTAITITSDGSTVDGFNVTGSGTDWNGGDADSGIKIKSDNNSVLNSTSGFNNYGVYVFESVDNTIENNSVYSNTEGIYTFYSPNNSILENDLTSNTNSGLLVSNSNNCIISNNTASKNSDGIYLSTSTDCSISNNIAYSNIQGIYLYLNSIDNILLDNNATDNILYGIHLHRSNTNTLTDNNATGNSDGIHLGWSESNTLISNNVLNNSNGIYFYSSSSNTLKSNMLTDNINYGIRLSASSSNTLTGNNVLNNGYGIGSTSTGYGSNAIYKNNLIENINYNVYDTAGSNSWSNNYYSDYTGLDSNDDGIGDTTYYITGGVGAKDLLPAMQPWNNAPFITLSSPTSTSVSDFDGNSRTFTATVDQVANVTWILDGITLHTNTSIQTASYYNNSAQLGTHNLTIVADNVNGTSHKKWTWTVTGIPAPSITLSAPSSSSVSDIEGNSRSFIMTVDQTANVTWILDGITLHTNTSIQAASYYNSSAQLGTHNLTIVADNVNGTSQNKWTWTVTGIPAPSITLSAPSSSSVSDIEGNSRSFIMTVDQTANVTWILDGITLHTNTSIQAASYYNSSAQLGTHNLTIVADNVNGTSQNKWTWTVAVPPAPSINLSSPSPPSISNIEGDFATFTATVDQPANIIWILDGNTIQTNTSVTTASYYNNSAKIGAHNLTVFAENANGTDQKNWTWTVSEITAPTITLSSPSSISIIEVVGASRTFTATVDQVSNVTWILDGNTIQTNTSITTASYYNTSAKAGVYNLTVIAENAAGTDQKKWKWYVGGASFTIKNGETKKLYEGYTLIANQVDVNGDRVWFSFEKDGTYVDDTIKISGGSFSFNRTIDGSSHLILQGKLDQVFNGQTTSLAVIENFYQFSETDGSVLIGESDDLNNIYPTITLFSPSSSSFTENTGDSRTFIVNVSQVANVTWILDGNTIQTNTSITTASYYNSSAQEGVHNVTVVAENTNGTDQKKWTWNVTTPNTYTMQLQKGWNLVSTPLTPDTPNVNTLFDSNSDVILPIYSWYTANKQYYDVSTIEISKGYWILALNDTQVTFAGTPYGG